MIELKCLNRELLLEYINSNDFGIGDDIPITFHRAWSQLKNPCLQKDDIILILAIEENSLVGYAGVLPDMISKKNGLTQKIGWLSCLWVSKYVRGKGIAERLIQESLQHYNFNILSADFVPFTKRIYDKTKYFAHNPYSKKGIRLYVLSDLHGILPSKHHLFSKIKYLLNVFDVCVNNFLKLRLRVIVKSMSDIQIETVDHIDEEINHFIESKQGKQLFKRKQEELNWILNHSWILSNNEKTKFCEKYYFSSTAKSFQFIVIKIKNTENKLVGFMMLSIKNNVMKLPYLYHDNCINVVAKVLFHIIKERKIKTFTSFHSELSQYLLNEKNPAFLKRPIQRKYMIARVLENEIFDQDVLIQDGDGDCVFT